MRFHVIDPDSRVLLGIVDAESEGQALDRHDAGRLGRGPGASAARGLIAVLGGRVEARSFCEVWVPDPA